MAVMMGDLYQALIEAKVPRETAQKAAEEVASHETSLSDIKSTQKLHTWMLGVSIAILVALLWKVFLP
jgi:hypothetical protein